jgi:DnaJ-class molecular chaperone
MICPFCHGDGVEIDTDVEYKKIDGQDEPEEVQIQVSRLCRNCDGRGYIDAEEVK